MKIGQIVKFKNCDGTLNGGTIVSFKKNSEGSDIALINTLDDQNVTISIDRVIPIKHQIIGKQSKAFVEKIKNEIKTHNNGVLSNSDVKKHRDEVQLWINKYNELTNESQKDKREIELLIKENNELIENTQKINKEYQEVVDELNKFKQDNKSEIEQKQNLQYAIIGMKKAILAGAEGNQKEQLEALLEVITDMIDL